MLKVGITGGIGSGKSIICKVFETLGVPIYYADERAKYLINNDLQLRKEIKELLGRNAYNEEGYNRAWVAQQVFQDENLLKQLNALVHPRVFEDTEKWLQKQQDKPYILREAALITKSHKLDKIIVVVAPIDLRISRIQKRDPQRTEDEIRAIITNQKTDKEFVQLADYQIINDEKNLVIPQILDIHQQLSNVYNLSHN